MTLNYISKAIFLCFFVCFTLGDARGGLAYDPHSIFECPDGSLLEEHPSCHLNVDEEAHVFETLTKTVMCPDEGVFKQKIGCIIVEDLIENNNGGYATITNGGLNEYFIALKLESQWSKGIKYRIEVYTLLDQPTTETAIVP